MIAQAPVSSYNKTNQLRRSKPSQTESDLKHKFMQTIGDETFKELEKIASEKGIRVQTLLRAVIIPEWAQKEGLSMDTKWNSTGLRRQTEKNAVKIGLRNSNSPPKFL
jgi:uncharacterized protein YbaP (TraB family)